MAPMQKKNVALPDETRKFEKGLLEIVTLGGVTIPAGSTFSAGLALVHLGQAPGQDQELRGAPPPISHFGAARRPHGRWQRGRIRPR